MRVLELLIPTTVSTLLAIFLFRAERRASEADRVDERAALAAARDEERSKDLDDYVKKFNLEQEIRSVYEHRRERTRRVAELERVLTDAIEILPDRYYSVRAVRIKMSLLSLSAISKEEDANLSWWADEAIPIMKEGALLGVPRSPMSRNVGVRSVALEQLCVSALSIVPGLYEGTYQRIVFEESIEHMKRIVAEFSVKTADSTPGGEEMRGDHIDG